MIRLLERSLRYAYLDFDSSAQDLLTKSGLSSLETERQRAIVIEAYKINTGIAPKYLDSLVQKRHIGYGTRQLFSFYLPRYKTVKYGKHSLRFLMPYLWNDLPNRFKALPDICEFKQAIKSWEGYTCKCRLCWY